MNQEKIGKFIAECRKNKKLTQQELAEKLNVSDKSISRWENGKTMMDISLFEPLCNDLDITINELLKGEKINNKKNTNKMSIETLINYSKYKNIRNKRLVLSILFVMSLSPMFLNQYGGLRGVQEISGLINILNPFGILSILMFILGIWFPFKNNKISKIFGACGVLGIVVSEIYNYFTWYITNITGEFSLYNSIQFAFPEFYIGLLISILMVVVYFSIDKIVKN